MSIHNLKTESKHFRDVWEGKKKAEIRKDDRDYEVGDGLILWEYCNGKKTGSRQLVIVTHILRGCPEYGLRDGYCILSFDHAGEEYDAGSVVRAAYLCLGCALRGLPAEAEEVELRLEAHGEGSRSDRAHDDQSEQLSEGARGDGGKSR